MTKMIQQVSRRIGRIAFGFCWLFAWQMQAQSGADLAWRSVQFGGLFGVQLSESSVQIMPLGSVRFSADLPIKVDKKRRRHIMGKWQNGAAHGFMLIYTISDDTVAGYVFVPQNAASANSCDSRTAALIANMAGAQQNVLNCARQELSWQRENNLTVEQATAEEQQRAADTATRQAFVPAISDAASFGGGGESNSLAGVWFSEVASAVQYKRIDLTLRPDGTYTKTFTARTSGWGGAGTVGAPSLGGTHTGRWTANGMMVHLSGDGNWPASDHNLAEFRRVQ